MSPHHVPNPRVINMAAINDKKQRKMLPTTSTNAERNELKQNIKFNYSVSSSRIISQRLIFTYQIPYKAVLTSD